jgi:hypothetical protein
MVESDPQIEKRHSKEVFAVVESHSCLASHLGVEDTLDPVPSAAETGYKKDTAYSFRVVAYPKLEKMALVYSLGALHIC